MQLCELLERQLQARDSQRCCRGFEMLEHTEKEYATFEKNRFEALNEQAENEHIKELENSLKKINKK